MKRNGFDNVDFFVGREVEHTAAYNHVTLFVVGSQSIAEVEAAIKDPGLIGTPITHLYFGANHSFAPDGTAEYYQPWETTILHFLRQSGYLVTLDFDVSDVEDVLECGFTEYNNFIPMVSVKIPYANQLGYNAIVKIDDTDFDHSNPGVWCHRLHDLQSNDRFTSWREYAKDTQL